MRDVFAHTSAWWGKYSGYVWKTAPDGHCYLHPAQNAKVRSCEGREIIIVRYLEKIEKGSGKNQRFRTVVA